MRLEVSPALSTNDRTDGRDADAVLIREFTLQDDTRFVGGADRAHGVIRQLGGTVALAATDSIGVLSDEPLSSDGDTLAVDMGAVTDAACGAIGVDVQTMPPLRNHVEGVVALRAEPEMVRIDAVANVAMVEDAEIIGDGADGDLEGDAMRQFGAASDIEAAVAAAIDATSPDPAIARAINLGPEAV
jgi:hypothetical protein